MYINKEKVIELMNEYCEGNYNAFARETGINVGHLYRTLKDTNRQAGPKFLGSLMIFCERNGLDYKDYIFLNEPLTVCNDSGRISKNQTA